MKVHYKGECCVRYRWDTTDPQSPGWYYTVETPDGTVVDDSQKIWAPVDVDRFGPHEASMLERYLKVAYPGAEIKRGGA